MAEFKIYSSGNYIKVEVSTGEEYIGEKSEVEVIPNKLEDEFKILNLIEFEEFSKSTTSKPTMLQVKLTDIVDGTNTPYTANSWRTFYENNTGFSASSGPGGSGGGLTDAELRATPVPVETELIQPLTNAELRSSAVPVSVSNFPTTQSVSLPTQATFNYNQAGVIAINTDLLVIDCGDASSISIQCISMGTAGVATLAWSNDNVNYPPTPSIVTTAGASPTTISAAGLWVTSVYGRYLRIRLTTATTAGTTTFAVQKLFSSNNIPVAGQSVTQSGTWTVQPGNTVNTTPWLITETPSASTGFSSMTRNNNTAASNMLTSVKTSAGTVNSIVVSNNNATTAYFFKLYNKASAPVLATDVPVMVVRIPASSSIVLPVRRLRLGIGIAFAVTGAATDTDATTIATANDIIVNINYI